MIRLRVDMRSYLARSWSKENLMNFILELKSPCSRGMDVQLSYEDVLKSAILLKKHLWFVKLTLYLVNINETMVPH